MFARHASDARSLGAVGMFLFAGATPMKLSIEEGFRIGVCGVQNHHSL